MPLNARQRKRAEAEARRKVVCFPRRKQQKTNQNVLFRPNRKPVYTKGFYLEARFSCVGLVHMKTLALEEVRALPWCFPISVKKNDFGNSFFGGSKSNHTKP